MGWDGISPGKGGGLIYTGLVFWADQQNSEGKCFVFGSGPGRRRPFYIRSFAFSFSFSRLFEFFSSLSSLGYERIPPLLIMMRGIVIVHASDSIVVMYNSSLRATLVSPRG